MVTRVWPLAIAVIAGLAAAIWLAARRWERRRAADRLASVAPLADALEELAEGRVDAPVPPPPEELEELAASVEDLRGELEVQQRARSWIQTLWRDLEANGMAPEHSDDDSSVTLAIRQVEQSDAVVVVVEIRRYAHPRWLDQPGEAWSHFEGDRARLDRIVANHGGIACGSCAQRSYFRFDAEAQMESAVLAAREVLVTLGRPENPWEDAIPPTIALCVGPITLSPSDYFDGRRRSVLGGAIHELDALVVEGRPGSLLVSPDLRRRMPPRIQGWPWRRGLSLATQQPFYGLALADFGGGVELPPLMIVDGGALGQSQSNVGALLGERYRLLDKLTENDSSAVYRAFDQQQGTVLALRRLPCLPGGSAQLDRWSEEARLASAVQHPHLARTLWLDEIDGDLWLASELIPGLALSAIIERSGPVPVWLGRRIGRQLCAGLAALHGRQIRHGALTSTSKILVTADGTGVLVDAVRPDLPLDRFLPEAQQSHLGGGLRGDLYGCGLLLYEMFTARSALGNGSGVEVPSPRALRGDLPNAVEELILRCLDPHPGARFQRPEQLDRALAALPAS